MENFCRAEQNATAQKGELFVKGKKLHVFFKPPPTKSSQPSEGTSAKREPTYLRADGNVVIHFGDRKAYANQATYNLVSGKATLEGTPLVETDEILLSSNLPVFYYEKERQAIARDAIFIHKEKQYVMRACTMKIIFHPTAEAIQAVYADGDVLITTVSCQFFAAQHAIYHVPHQEVQLKDQVQVARGNNLLTADQAVADLQTENLRLYNKPSAHRPHRIQAVFVPENLQNAGLSAKAG